MDRPPLADRVATALGARHPRVVAADVGPDGSHTATVGLPGAARVEIGSVTKGLTGLLYVDARARGVVTDGTPLGDLLDVGDAVGRVTLGSLATHRSGLPRLAAGAALRPTWELLRHGRNPYGDDLATLLAHTRRTTVGSTRSRYSNLGFMLLGHALGAAEGLAYRDLLARRVLGPVGMTATVLPFGPDELGPDDVVGTSRRGRPREAWTGEGVGPAGSARSTAADLERLLAALLDGSAPGIQALDPVAEVRGRGLRIGAAWHVLSTPQGEVVWHNGGTGGFRSMVCLDRSAGVGLAVVSATARSVDRAAFGLLADLRSSAAG